MSKPTSGKAPTPSTIPSLSETAARDAEELAYRDELDALMAELGVEEMPDADGWMILPANYGPGDSGVTKPSPEW